MMLPLCVLENKTFHAKTEFKIDFKTIIGCNTIKWPIENQKGLSQSLRFLVLCEREKLDVSKSIMMILIIQGLLKI